MEANKLEDAVDNYVEEIESGHALLASAIDDIAALSLPGLNGVPEYRRERTRTLMSNWRGELSKVVGVREAYALSALLREAIAEHQGAMASTDWEIHDTTRS